MAFICFGVAGKSLILRRSAIIFGAFVGSGGTLLSGSLRLPPGYTNLPSANRNGSPLCAKLIGSAISGYSVAYVVVFYNSVALLHLHAVVLVVVVQLVAVAHPEDALVTQAEAIAVVVHQVAVVQVEQSLFALHFPSVSLLQVAATVYTDHQQEFVVHLHQEAVELHHQEWEHQHHHD